MSIQLKVPDIGDFEQVEIIEVIVKAGESIKTVSYTHLRAHET